VPAPLGLAPEALREVLAYAAGEATLVGAEITSAAPGYAQVAADAIAPLLAYGAAAA
jgi:arginase family enzyme